MNYERNYAGWLAEARRRFAEEIERCIDCKKTTFYGPSKRIRVEPSAERGGSTLHQTSGGNERKYGDAGQSGFCGGYDHYRVKAQRRAVQHRQPDLQVEKLAEQRGLQHLESHPS